MADKFINATELMTELAMLYKHANWSPRECHFSLFDMQMNIDGMKPADVAPVVRCKECVWCKDLDENGWCWCGNDGYGMPQDGFCSYGERRDPDA